MATIKAPFNFVPLSEKVFFPNWADQISHDIPFEDGESGTIELKITAESPIFVRNGHTKDEANNKSDGYKSFSNINGQYFIPATTIKGAIRNVLEIISFGKMDRIANQRYSLRDLKLKREYLYFFQDSDVHCGWMSKFGDVITISDHGIPKRISHLDLDELWDTDFSETFKDRQILQSDVNRTALYKIKKAEGKNKTVKYNEFPMNSVNPVDKRIIANVDEKGAYEGIIVLTGQPSAREDKVVGRGNQIIKKAKGKCFEFIFPNNEIGSHSFDMENEIYKDFCFIYKDSEDWKYWKKELEKGNRVPVFFSLKQNTLIHFGLSYLYKLPYENRIKDCLPENHISSSFDLSECVFGSTQKNKSVKGRIQFSHAFMKDGHIDKELLAYMGSPKSSYYPIYLQQEGSEGYMTKPFITMMSRDAKLKGWKRYPIRNNLMEFTIPQGQEEHSNPFVPISKGSVFNCKIRFHNLRKSEIGALLKALSFNRQGFHSLGFAKPYGYGTVKIEPVINHSRFSIEEYISSFTEMMKNFDADYTKSIELKELNLMSQPQNTKRPLEYMNLTDFVSCKRSGEYLEYYSSIVVQEKTTTAVKEMEAEITYNERGLTKAKLLDGKDVASKVLKDVDSKLRLKPKDRVLVRLSNNGKELIFIKKK